MQNVFEQEELPSGKTITRQFGKDGSLLEEMHSHGALVIAIQYAFLAGAKVDELYFVKQRMVSRRTYEKARIAYSDMPAADDTREDTGAELLRAVAKERRLRQRAKQQHQVDAEAARKLDEFCSALMTKGKCEDAATWIQNKNHTLGERDWRSSKRLVERFSKLGCVHIYACEIDRYDEDDKVMENTGQLVMELPSESKVRSKVLKAIDGLASQAGYDGPRDCQRYAFVKLD